LVDLIIHDVCLSVPAGSRERNEIQVVLLQIPKEKQHNEMTRTKQKALSEPLPERPSKCPEETPYTIESESYPIIF
jgi:hypothetical protein